MSKRPFRPNTSVLALAVVVIFLVFNIGFLLYSDVTHNQSKLTPNNPNDHRPLSTSTSVATAVEAGGTEEMKPDTISKITVIPDNNKTLAIFIQVTDGCQAYFQGECLRVRSGPGTSFPAVYKLRNGVVLKTSESKIVDGITWYKITFDEWLRYPDRLGGSWWIAGDYVKVIRDIGTITTENSPVNSSTTKEIIVDRSDQKLYAYENGQIFMTATTSTGLKSTPTPRGIFHIYKKTPSRYMQGPLPGVSDQYYDLPGVPWNLYFSEEGAVIHGAYWHNSFGTPYSHGCVNLEIDDAYKLYNWAELGVKVTVRD